MRGGAKSRVLEPSSHEKTFIKTPTSVCATLYNTCDRREVTIQSNVHMVSNELSLSAGDCKTATRYGTRL